MNNTTTIKTGMTKSRPIKTWLAPLALLAALVALPVRAPAAPKVVNTATTAYDSCAACNGVTGTAALTVYGAGAIYNGANITLTGSATGVGAYGAYVYNQGRVGLHDSNIASNFYGIWEVLKIIFEQKITKITKNRKPPCFCFGIYNIIIFSKLQFIFAGLFFVSFVIFCSKSFF
jgi:hypothetical protein